MNFTNIDFNFIIYKLIYLIGKNNKIYQIIAEFEEIFKK